METILPTTVTFDLDEFERSRRNHLRIHEEEMRRWRDTREVSNPEHSDVAFIIAGTYFSLTIASEIVFASGYRRIMLARCAGDIRRGLRDSRLQLPEDFDIGVMLTYGPDIGWGAAQGIVVSDKSELFDEWPRQLMLDLEKLRPTVDS